MDNDLLSYDTLDIGENYIQDTEKEVIKSYANLINGWDYGHGYAPSIITIEMALLLSSLVKYFGLKSSTNPITEGGISMTIFKDSSDRFMVVSILPNDIFNVVIEKGKGFDYVIEDEKESLNYLDILDEIKNFCDKCSSYEPYMYENTIEIDSDLTVMPLKIMAVGFQYLKSPAQYKNLGTYAVISHNFTNQLLVTQ